MIDRWHFRMINDKKRNLAYFLALQKAFDGNYVNLLDIGSGTGLLSLFAAKIGYGNVYTCECCEVMCDIQKQVIQSHNALCHLVELSSTDISIPKHIPQRVNLVVTEIFDCSLIGEGCLPTLIHAHENLIINENSKVIPQSADVFGVCIECEELRKHAKYSLDDHKIVFIGSHDNMEEDQQYYSSEYMSTIKGGYKEITKSFKIQNFDFDNKQNLLEAVGTNVPINVTVKQSGRIDAIIIYFHLKLDDSITIKTHPESKTCWEQAIYTNYDSKSYEMGDVVNIESTCHEDHFSFKLHSAGVCNDMTASNEYVDFTIFNINRQIVARMNDAMYLNEYCQCMLQEISKKKMQKEVLSICFLQTDVSLLPAIVADNGSDKLYFIEPSAVLLKFLLKYQANLAHRITVLQRPIVEALSECSVTFDLVIGELINPNGLLSDHMVEDLTVIKCLCCNEDTVFIPQQIEIHAMLISCDELRYENEVCDNSDVTLGFNVASFINEYKVSTVTDINILNKKYDILTKPFACGTLDLMKILHTDKDADELNLWEENVDVTILENNKVTAVIYWYHIHLYDEQQINTAPSEKSHWKTSSCLFSTDIDVVVDQMLQIKVTRNKNNLHFQVT